MGMINNGKFNFDCIEYNSIQERYFKRIFSYNQLTKSKLPYYCHSYVASFASPKLKHFTFGIDNPPPQQLILNRSINALMLHFVISGTGLINGSPIQRGTFYYFAPCETHTIVADGQKPWKLVWLAFSGEYADHILNKLHKVDSPFLSFSYPDQIDGMANFFMYQSNFGETSEKFCLGLIDQFMSYVSIGTSTTDIKKVTPHMQAIASKAIRDIEKNYATTSVAQLAQNLHLDRVYFTRIFRATTGITPQEYITKFRMNIARDMLSENDISINELLELVGYQHRNGFESAFFKQFGLSPKQYRDYAKQNNASKQSNQN